MQPIYQYKNLIFNNLYCYIPNFLFDLNIHQKVLKHKGDRSFEAVVEDLIIFSNYNQYIKQCLDTYILSFEDNSRTLVRIELKSENTRPLNLL